jgi:hypothetical protein
MHLFITLLLVQIYSLLVVWLVDAEELSGSIWTQNGFTSTNWSPCYDDGNVVVPSIVPNISFCSIVGYSLPGASLVKNSFASTACQGVTSGSAALMVSKPVSVGVGKFVSDGWYQVTLTFSLGKYATFYGFRVSVDNTGKYWGGNDPKGAVRKMSFKIVGTSFVSVTFLRLSTISLVTPFEFNFGIDGPFAEDPGSDFRAWPNCPDSRLDCDACCSGVYSVECLGDGSWCCGSGYGCSAGPILSPDQLLKSKLTLTLGIVIPCLIVILLVGLYLLILRRRRLALEASVFLVIPFSEFCKFSKLPTKEQAKPFLFMPRKKHHITFISHKWFNANEPDSPSNELFAWIKSLNLQPDECLWIDWCCIQPNTQVSIELIISLIPNFIERCHNVECFCFDVGSYRASAWCYLEAASSKQKSRMLTVTKNSAKEIVRNDLELRIVKTTVIEDLKVVLSKLKPILYRQGISSSDLDKWERACLSQSKLSVTVKE